MSPTREAGKLRSSPELTKVELRAGGLSSQVALPEPSPCLGEWDPEDWCGDRGPLASPPPCASTQLHRAHPCRSEAAGGRRILRCGGVPAPAHLLFPMCTDPLRELQLNPAELGALGRGAPASLHPN